MNVLAALIALSLVAPGDKLIRGNMGTLIPNPDDKVGPILTCPFTTPGDYATGITSLCTPATALTITRSSSATYENPAGTLATATANRLRVNANGALIEAGATNTILQSNALTTSPWIAEGAGASAAPVITGGQPDPWGGNTAWRVDFAAAPGDLTDGSILKQSQNLTNAVRTTSVWAKAVSGTPTFSIGYGVVNNNGAPSYCSPTTSAWTRCTLTYNPGGAVTWNLNIGNDNRNQLQSPGDLGASSVYLWGVQHEMGSVPTSYIPTTTTAVARQADNVTVASPYTGVPSMCIDFTAWEPAAYIDASACYGENCVVGPAFAGLPYGPCLFASMTGEFLNKWIPRNGSAFLGPQRGASTVWRLSASDARIRVYADGMLLTDQAYTYLSLSATLKLGDDASGVARLLPQATYKNLKWYNVPCSKAR